MDKNDSIKYIEKKTLLKFFKKMLDNKMKNYPD